MKESRLRNTLRSTTVLAFTLLLCTAGYFSPLMPEGLGTSMQAFITFLSATMLGGLHGTAAVGLWFILGSLGLPVLTQATGSLGAITGPYSGYIWAYFVLSFIAGIVVGTPHLFERKFILKIWCKIAALTIVSYLVSDLAGLVTFRNAVISDPTSEVYGAISKMTSHEQWIYSAEITCLATLPFDIAFCIASIPLASSARALVAKILYPSDEIMEEELLEEIKKKQERIERIFHRKKTT